MKTFIARIDEAGFQQLPRAAWQLLDCQDGEQHATRRDGRAFLSWTYRFSPEVWRRLRAYSHVFRDGDGAEIAVPGLGPGVCRYCRQADAAIEVAGEVAGHETAVRDPAKPLFTVEVARIAAIRWVSAARTVCAQCAETIVAGGTIEVWTDGTVTRSNPAGSKP